MLKGIIHCHSKYSFDSLLSMSGIIKMIEKHQLDFVILTDHNTIQGAIALRRALKQHNLQHVQVPIAAEYHTEHGDVIAAFISKELNNTQSFESFVKQVQEQDGIILLPHPFKGHENIEKLAFHSDLIEVFNSRQNESVDRKSKELQEKFQKPAYFASDAHLSCEYENVIVQIEHDSKDLKKALLSGKITSLNKMKSSIFDILISQFIKALKLKDLKLFLNVFKSILQHMVTLKLFKRL